MLRPALFTRMSQRPYFFSMSLAILVTADAFIRSPVFTSALPPAFLIAAAVSCSGSLRRPVSTTVAPSPASAIAAA